LQPGEQPAYEEEEGVPYGEQRHAEEELPRVLHATISTW
jgi:hypothetical protein